MLDEDKNEEELTKVQAELEAAKALLAAKEAEHVTLNEQLTKLRTKDFNFRRLESMTQEELDKLTETEIELKRRQEKLEDDQKQFKTATVQQMRKEAISKFSKGDEEKAKKLEYYFDQFKGDAEDKDTIMMRAEQAAKLAFSTVGANPIGDAMGISGEAPSAQNKNNFSDTAEGRGLAQALGMSFVKQK